MFKNNLIVLYHRPESKSWFEKTIKTLGKIYNFVSSQDIIDYYNNDLGLSNSCHITFDDGHRSIYDYAYPVLKKYNLNASLFVSPSVLENNQNYWFQDIEKYDKNDVLKSICNVKKINLDVIKKIELNQTELAKSLSYEEILLVLNELSKSCGKVKNSRLNVNKKELIELSNSGNFTIGSHTYNHPILSNEKYDYADYQITESLNYLKKLLNKEVNTFAFPNGIPNLDYGKREINICKINNIKAAYSCEISYFNKINSKLAIPRLEISSGGSIKTAIKAIFLNSLRRKLSNEKVYNNRLKIKNLLNNIS